MYVCVCVRFIDYILLKVDELDIISITINQMLGNVCKGSRSQYGPSIRINVKVYLAEQKFAKFNHLLYICEQNRYYVCAINQSNKLEFNVAVYYICARQWERFYE